MDKRALIYKLMYQGLLDIRAAAREKKSYEAIFKIAHILHNIPLQLERVERGEGSYDEILDDLRLRAHLSGCESWFENAVRQF